MLLAGEDMDLDVGPGMEDPFAAGAMRGGGSMRGGGGGGSIGLSHVRGDSSGGGGGGGGGAGGSTSYRDLSYAATPSTPWDSATYGDPRTSMEALHHPSRAPPSEATQYMSQYLMRARGSETGSMFREGVWPPPGEALVDPILGSSSEVDLNGIVESVMGPGESRDADAGAGGWGGGGGEGYGPVGGGHSRNISGNSNAPLLPLAPGGGGSGSFSTPPSPPLPPLRSVAPAKPSPLKDVMRAGTSSGDHGTGSGGGGGGAGMGGEEEDKVARTKHWIERTLAR